jgi:poly(3-hydroxyalkanoate) depolymerase
VNGQRVRTVDVGHAVLRVGVRGDGPPIILLTGIGANLEMWDPFERALHGFQTISIDMPGTGESTSLRRPLRMPGVAGLVVKVMDALDIPTADVLGVSYGGAVAQQLAHRSPTRVRRLVLAATAAGVPGLGGVPGDPRGLLAMATIRRYTDPEYIRAHGHRIYGGGPYQPNPTDLQARLARPPSVRGYLHQLWAIQCWTSVPWLHSLRQPTLVLAGDDDRLMPLVNGRILAMLIPDAHLEIVRGGGHLFIVQRSSEVAPIITSFLTGADASHR